MDWLQAHCGRTRSSPIKMPMLIVLFHKKSDIVKKTKELRLTKSHMGTLLACWSGKKISELHVID